MFFDTSLNKLGRYTGKWDEAIDESLVDPFLNVGVTEASVQTEGISEATD